MAYPQSQFIRHRLFHGVHQAQDHPTLEDLGELVSLHPVYFSHHLHLPPEISRNQLVALADARN